MTKQFLLAAALSALLATAGATVAFAQDSNAENLVGAWRMVSLAFGEPGGELTEVPYSGQIIFTEAGTVSTQAMNPDETAPDNAYTVNGYEAFYGTYALGEGNETFTITVESSLIRSMIGGGFERAFEATEDQLVLMPTSPDENWRVVYERY